MQADKRSLLAFMEQNEEENTRLQDQFKAVAEEISTLQKEVMFLRSEKSKIESDLANDRMRVMDMQAKRDVFLKEIEVR